VRFHDLRHTAIALWIAAGASPKQIAAWAGHTSTSVVLDRYGHLFPEADEKLVEALEQTFQRAHKNSDQGEAGASGSSTT
jgi:integrase